MCSRGAHLLQSDDRVAGQRDVMTRRPARSMLLIIAATLLMQLSSASDFEAPRVKTPLGSIRGHYKISEYGRPYEAYEGVPYALPPIGKLRFKEPQPVAAWSGELPATKVSHGCLQYTHNPSHVKGDPVIGSEDCLYLNVYVPEREGDSSLLPVVLWIHGGAFSFGSSHMLGPKYVMDANILFVSINYRLGPLGFLSTEDSVVPGNMGLKDQSMALRWVHENIEYFGGDPEKITLVGDSAGGASVHYHYLSPLSAGLFRNGISLSGTALHCWAQTENALEKAKKLGTLMGCPTKSNKEMVKCLKQRPARAMVEALKEFMPWLYNPYTPFGPVVEKQGDKPFIDRPPVEKLESGDVLDVPWLTSLTKDEGLYPVAEFASNEELLKELDENWASIVPHLLDFNYTIPSRLHEATAMKIKKHYLGNNRISRKNVQAIIKMVGDRLFVVDSEKAARLQARANRSPVWFYYFAYRGAGSLSDVFSGTKEDFGVSHADDCLYVLNSIYMDPTTTESDRAMTYEFLQLWEIYASKDANEFASFWRKVDPSKKEFNYLTIAGPGQLEMNSDDNLGDKKFWSSIDFAENNHGFKTDIKDEL